MGKPKKVRTPGSGAPAARRQLVTPEGVQRAIADVVEASTSTGKKASPRTPKKVTFPSEDDIQHEQDDNPGINEYSML